MAPSGNRPDRVPSALAVGQTIGEWRLAIQSKLQSQYTLTKATADKSEIVTAGTVVVLKKDDLRLLKVGDRTVPGNSYTNGLDQAELPGRWTTPNMFARTYMAGEKLWLTKILFESGGDGVDLEFLSDPADDNVRYWGTLKFSFPKTSPPTPEQFVALVSQV